MVQITVAIAGPEAPLQLDPGNSIAGPLDQRLENSERHGLEGEAHALPPELQADDSEPVVEPEVLTELRRLKREDRFHVTHPHEYCLREWREFTRHLLVATPEGLERLPERGVCHLPNEWPVNLQRHFQVAVPSARGTHLDADDLAGVTMPVLTVHGTEDRNAAYGAGREWAYLLPDARLLTVEDAAHQSFADAPDLVFGAIETFLDGSWPDGVERVAESPAC